MRTYHIIAAVAIISAGAGAQIFFTSPTAESLPTLTNNTGVDGSQLHQSSLQAQVGNFSRGCARQEIAAITLIENHGAAGDVSSDRLGQAGLTMLRARMACYEGRAGEALALYESILNLGPVASLSGQ
jgi:hypothetical protein